MRKRLMKLRQLILDTARRTGGVGKVEEALRRAMPSYLTPQTKSGTTVRIHWTEKDPDRYAMYFHCQTSLVSTFRRLYPTQLTYEGNRAIVFHDDDEPPIPELRHCISLALTYHLDKQGRRSGPSR